MSYCHAQSTTTKPITFPNRDLSCNFEEGFCQYENQGSDGSSIVWKRNNGPTLNDLTGPLTDHTYENATGHYAYIDVIIFIWIHNILLIKTSLRKQSASSLKVNETARLISQPLTIKSNGYCYKFWYHMYGKTINSLNIIQQSYGNFC